MTYNNENITHYAQQGIIPPHKMDCAVNVEVYFLPRNRSSMDVLFAWSVLDLCGICEILVEDSVISVKLFSMNYVFQARIIA